MNIKTERLELRPINLDSLDALADLFSDELVKQTYMVPDFPTREDALKLAERIKNLSEDPDRYVAGIYLGHDLVGLLNETERKDQQIEVGYALLPQYHNQGYCTEALQGAMRFLFREGFHSVVAGAFEENPASIRVMVKSGMTKMDHQDTVDYRGKTHTCVYYQKERPERVLVSACLLGRNCKYNGGNNCNPAVKAYIAGREVVEYCPEVMAGLGIPRTPIEIVDGILMDRNGNNVDELLRQAVEKAMAEIRDLDIDCAILQSRSPTCGVNQVYDGTFSGKLIPGSGVFAQALKDAGYRVMDSEDIEN